MKWQDKLENEYVRLRVEIESIWDKDEREPSHRLRWFWNVELIEEDYVDLVKTVRKMQILDEARGGGDLD